MKVFDKAFHPQSLRIKHLFFVCLLMALTPAATAQAVVDSMAQAFRRPPEDAAPRTFWHWTGGNITREGILKDLRWMKQVGIGGVQIGDLSAGCCQTIADKVPFRSLQWYQDVKLAATESRRLHLEMSLFSSAGWSLAGGPWVKPAEAMKKLVWSDTVLQGPLDFQARLPHPPTVNGPFQNMSRARKTDPVFYGQTAVLAYRTPADEQEAAGLHPEVTTSAGSVDGTPLLDHDLNSGLSVSVPRKGGPAWIQLKFAKPFTARAVSIAAPKGIPFARVLASTDGRHYRPIAVMPGPQNYRGGKVRTFSFPAVTATYFKVEMTAAAPSPAEVILQPRPHADSIYTLTELTLHGGARVNRWEDKACFGSFLDNYTGSETPAYPSAAVIDTASIIDLSEKMDPDGTLHWNVPPGKWTIMRFGYSLTGAKNRPARPGGLGYEVDKLNPRYVNRYLDGYLDSLAQVLGPLFGSALSYVTLDSWEAGMQNWTDDMVREFKKRRGYDPTPYLPVLAGRVVGSAAISDRFLWDFRRTLADMFAENFYGTVTAYLHKKGLKTYGEASGVSLVIPEDALANKKLVDIPMGEFWVHHLHPESMYYFDVRGAASAAHVYGKPLVAAESFTGGGYQDPYTLKSIADYWLTQGVNRIVLHNTALQPLDTKPGNMMVGTNFNRNITWAGLARPFMTYLSRACYLLQQGNYVADIAYLLKEGAPSSMPFWGAGLRPAPPEGYDYDFVNTDVLLNRMKVAGDGSIVLPGGMRYRLLVLPPVRRMTLPVLRKIAGMVKAGATVVGPRPTGSPSLAGYPAADEKIRALADSVWGDINGISLTKSYYGKGRVFWGLPLARVLSLLSVPRDVTLDKPLGARFSWIHRRGGKTDIYFIANLTDSVQQVRGRFRVTAPAVSLWDPVGGAVRQVSCDTASGFSTVSLHLPRHGSVFVVFSPSVPASGAPAVKGEMDTLMTVKGPWKITFPMNLGAPPAVTLPRLDSWTMSEIKGVKYFSGTATYHKSFQLKAGQIQKVARLLLDLGDVKDIAQVFVNGRPLGILWTPPFRVEVTDALRTGTNDLVIKVTNEWVNRLIGDATLPSPQRILSSGLSRFGRPPALRPSGLLGPVRLEKYRIAPSKHD
jgi:hypothetical protein